MKKIFYALFLSVTIFGCQSDDATLVNNDPQQNEPVSIQFENVTKGSFSGGMAVFPQGNYVINNLAAWTAFYTRPLTNQVVQTNITPDFNAYTYIAVRHHYHAESNEDVDINIQSITQEDGTITVKYIKTTYTEGDPLLLMENHPYHMVRIPATTMPVVFEQL